MILIKRKLFRMFGLPFPIVYLLSGLALPPWYDRIPVLLLLLLFIGWMLFLESWRFRNPKVNRWLFERFKGFTKEKERDRVSSTTLFLTASAVTILLFPRGVAVPALLFLTFGDPVAEIVGVNYGRVKVLCGKTLEGTLAGAAACFLAGACLLPLRSLGLTIPVLAAGAAAAALTELLPFPVDDNFTIPIGAGIAMLAAQALLGPAVS